MANKIVVDTGKLWITKIAVTNGNAKLDTNVKIRLFANNYTPVQASVIGNFTEIAYTGYAAVTLSGAVDGGIDANDRDTWTWPTVTFQCTSSAGLPVTAYGYYVTDSANTTVLWAERFSTAQVFTTNGDGFTVPPQFSGGSIF